VYLLDTDILSLFESGHERVIAAIKQSADQPATTAVTFAELIGARCARLLKAADAQQLLSAQLWLDRSLSTLATFQVILFSERAANVFTQLNANAKVRKIGRADVLIASIGLAHGAMIVTRNVRHFSVVPGLRVANWADE
jgi:tRNA(fMet)-specific endonuclease VapC